MGTMLLAAAIGAAGVWGNLPKAHAEGDQTIRVALFADIGSKYKLTVPTVTLQSKQAWSIGAAAGSSRALEVAGGSTVRVSLDGYRVKVMETSSWDTAAAAAKKLQSTSDKPLLFLTSKKGTAVYQLYTGMYASESAASNAAARVAKAGISLPEGQSPGVKGSRHLSAGRYATRAEADLARTSVSGAGFDAATVLMNDGQFEVWIGEAANEADLSALQGEVQAALPELTLMPVGSNVNALILRVDAGLDWNAERQAAHYALAGSKPVFIASGNNEGIQVEERSKRIYRGNIELSALNGSLSVINVVPLEQYLYSVVGAEVSPSWPKESLKAQAVAARSYALSQGNRFDVAHVVDTTLSQVYNGISSEAKSIVEAVDATAGEVLMSGGKIVEAVFSSNSGGVTADPSEVWNSGGEMFASVASPGDVSATASAKSWYQIMLENGASGYVREDNVKLTDDKSAAGLSQLTATVKDVNVRPIPAIQQDVKPVGKLNPGERAVVLGKTEESGSYSWVRGPYTPAELVKFLQGKATGVPSSITSLEVSARGPSGRVTEVKANGTVLKVKYPDLFRSAFGGLPSTLFDIVPAGGYTVLGSGGTSASMSGSTKPAILSASGTGEGPASGMLIMNGNGQARAASSGSGYLFVGKGYGHGLGMSQWGAKGMADEGYDYKQILQHYYRNVTITKP